MIATPYYLIDKSKLKRNMETIAAVRAKSGAKALLVWRLLVNYGHDNDWIVGLNLVFGALYIMSLVFTYTSIRLPAKRV